MGEEKTTTKPQKLGLEIVGGELRGYSPLDGAALKPVPITPIDELAGVVSRAREAQAKWAALTPADRARRLERLVAGLMARAKDFAELLHAEVGKSRADAYVGEIVACRDLFGYWAKTAPPLLQPEAKSLNPFLFPKKAGITALRPKGVVGLIAPWNYPLFLPVRTLIPALAAGNAVVLKPSEYAPRIGERIVELFATLGFDGLVSVIQGDAEVGRALIAAGVDHVVFTGSVANGRAVSTTCAQTLTPCSLELGGKDPALVLEDADLDRAADGIIWGAFVNAGQFCGSVERVYVVEAVATPFIDKILERTNALVVAAPGRDVYDVGPLVRPAGLALVEKQIAEALEQGATVRAGGEATGDGLCFAPTVLTDVTDEMAIMQEETFGPVLPIVVVPDEAAALQGANASRFGLTASLWTRDLQRGRDLANQLDCGVVGINNHGTAAAVPHAPWTGTKDSGGGVGNSPYAFYELTTPSYVLVDRSRSKDLWWFPHTPALAQLGVAMATLAGTAGGKLAALVAMIKGMLGRWR